jgi:hypothetical protein
MPLAAVDVFPDSEAMTRSLKTLAGFLVWLVLPPRHPDATSQLFPGSRRKPA